MGLWDIVVIAVAVVIINTGGKMMYEYYQNRKMMNRIKETLIRELKRVEEMEKERKRLEKEKSNNSIE